MSSPSGAGKTSISKKLLQKDRKLALSISCTTRPRRKGEINKKDYIFITDDEFKKQLKVWVRKKIGPIATPDVIHWAPNLPKTRSGKIMRRILRKIAHNDLSSLGDTSTLADPSVIDEFVANQPK